jgi:hypothetical protein
MQSLRIAGALALCLLALSVPAARASFLQPIASGFDQPIYVTSDPANANRLFVVERKGTIELVENGVRSPFADITAKVGCGASCEKETGLMSIALAPDFDSSGHLYVDYADEPSGEIHVGEMTATGPQHESAAETSLKLVLGIPHPGAKNHNGGQLQFGPDGALYVSTGDGGGGEDQFHNAQDPESLLGKILRVAPKAGGVGGYTVPAGNPFAGVTPPYDTVWNLGLRNPFRFSFDRLTGDIVIADVGQAAREEIDFGPAPWRGVGANYGWNCREGFLAGPATDPECASLAPAALTPPVFDYSHTPDPEAGGESRCAIIGGYVVRDLSLGSLYGNYLYGDYCSGTIRALQLPGSATGLASDDCWTGLSVPGINSFGEDAVGRVYAVAESGTVYRLAGLPPPNCPAPVAEPGLTRFTVVGIRAQRRLVERGKAAVLTVFVSPCEGRRGQTVRLLRNGRPNGSRFLDRACTARFLPRVRRGTTFRATIREERGYPAGQSRRLRIRIDHSRRAQRR